jgi:hypothetical protein
MMGGLDRYIMGLRAAESPGDGGNGDGAWGLPDMQEAAAWR